VSDPAFDSAPVFEVDSVSYAYLERFIALDGVSFTVDAGERVALLGANGCGKSTLLQILDALRFPDSGTLHAFGALITEDQLEDEQLSRGFRGRVGFVFQNADAQVFSPTVREEIAFGPLQMGLDSDAVERRVGDIVSMLDIGELLDRAPYQLSEGQKKQVALASVLVMNPEVLLLDEPTATLDPRSRQWLLELLAELDSAGKTIVMATHDLETLGAMADRCLVLSEEHKLVAEGTPSTILADEELLRSVNLIHEHGHIHGGSAHSHPHDGAHHGAAG